MDDSFYQLLLLLVDSIQVVQLFGCDLHSFSKNLPSLEINFTLAKAKEIFANFIVLKIIGIKILSTKYSKCFKNINNFYIISYVFVEEANDKM